MGQGPTPEMARPAEFHSRKLSPAQTNYPTHQQELLAVVEAIKAFDPLLASTKFIIVTDHEALKYLKSQSSLSPRQIRWLNFLSKYEFEIRYMPGKTNVLANYLSRIHEGKGPEKEDIILQ